jgi:hypothetical protein
MTVMNPFLSQKATWVSLGALVLSLATTIISLPDGLLASVLPAADVHVILIMSEVIVGLAGTHLSASRSVLPSVDSPK